MFLERVEISGFRGINQLSLVFDENMILIGENAWGKSRLLGAFTVLLSPKPELYYFNEFDFYHTWDENSERKCDLQIILTFPLLLMKMLSRIVCLARGKSIER
ncbi:ATP-dependent endonuclease [Xenorhabdus vietnamensis]|uniref:ATP-dependent endonuclease n=1 Tax=Xenorhabdus vietnamensis TaxID=351656 RepID=A0A1Y2SEI9_9GAMM|nr:DUF2813 domain-containing protein [Xenorhabdus vietnamensis]OTA16382.1 ATP-dependent endonuclease [Xenorhabdus vietnamensis]